MTAPFWSPYEESFEGADYATNPWDLLLLNKKKVPGKSAVTCPRKERLDVPKKNGGDGGTIVRRGFMPGEISIVVTLWTPAQWRLWQELLDEVWRLPSKPPKQDPRIPVLLRRSETTISKEEAVRRTGAIEIYHPALPKGVTHVVLAEVGSPLDGSVVGTKDVRIKAVQYVPQTTVNVTRRAEGPRVQLAPEIRAATNVPPKPSQSDTVPALLRRPPGT